MTRAKPRRGYTIVELLIVIAVIGILTAILLAVVTRAKGKGRQITCTNNLAQFYKYIIYYVDEHDGVLPKIEGIGWLDDLTLRCTIPLSADILKCPSDKDPMPVSVYEVSYASNCTFSKKPLTSIERPSNTALFADIGRNAAGNPKFCSRFAWVFKRYAAFRHFDRMNTMFADGSIRSLNEDEIHDDMFRPPPR